MSRTFLTAGAAAGTATWQSQGWFVGRRRRDWWGSTCSRSHRNLGGGFKDFLIFISKLGKWFPIWPYNIFCRWVGSTTNYKLGVEFSVKLDTAWDDIWYKQICKKNPGNELRVSWPLETKGFLGIRWPGGWPTLTSNLWDNSLGHELNRNEDVFPSRAFFKKCYSNKDGSLITNMSFWISLPPFQEKHTHTHTKTFFTL